MLIVEDGKEYAPPADADLIANFQKPDGKFAYNAAKIDEGNRILVELTNQVLAVPGEVVCEVEIRAKDSSQVLTSCTFTVKVGRSNRNENAILSSNEMTAFDAKWATLNSSMEEYATAERLRADVTDEQAFDAARADVQARLTGVADWDVQPAYTLVMADADTRPMTERETADAILRAAGGEITEGTAVYLDGALRFVTDEGDHLRQFLYAVRAPWQTDGVQTDFVHALRLVDGIYPAAAITPYRDLTAALRADDLLQVKAVRYETVTQELPFETQTIEDAGLDFGKTETVQAGQNGSELVTSEITTVAGEVVSTRVVDVQLVQAAVPEVIHRGTRLKSGMIGRLGTGSFLWPVPGYSGISRWASLPYGHRGVDITAPYGTPIYAADAGTVIAAQWHNHPTMSWGYYVEIDHGNGYKTLYAHMSSFVVQAGQTVEKGQLIGYVGATGAATGSHCHFEMYYNNALISARNVFPDM